MQRAVRGGRSSVAPPAWPKLPSQTKDVLTSADWNTVYMHGLAFFLELQDVLTDRAKQSWREGREGLPRR